MLSIPGYHTTLEHLQDECQRIDLLIHLQVLRLRAQGSMTGDDAGGLYISEAEVDYLLARTAFPWTPVEEDAALCAPLLDRLSALETQIATHKAASAQAGVELRLERLARLFQLSALEQDILLVCLAPEVDVRYEKLYAYVQDDVTRKRPSVALALALLSPSLPDRLAARQYMFPTAPLFRHGLLEVIHEPDQASRLSRFLQVNERVVHYIFGSDAIDSHLTPYAQLVVPQCHMADLVVATEIKHNLLRLFRQTATGGPLVSLQGAYGVGKQSIAEALCQEVGCKLLVVNGERLLQTDPTRFDDLVRLLTREARLQQAALYWQDMDGLGADDQSGRLRGLWRELESHPGPVFLAGTTSWEPADVLHTRAFVRLELPLPSYRERLLLWTQALQEFGETAVDIPALANQFRLSGGQIRDALATARRLGRWHDNAGLSMADLCTACRMQSNRKLSTLAQAIVPHHTWDDMVLPADRLQQLRELCNAVQYRARVYDDWGFDRKISLGKGLNALFAGPSGTGKTMAAEVIAGELGLDLYKIDLSTVVSKYIGETEKNLARIFMEATTSNAILFFDEADALFGKRSEVRDAHDRYANIEISYLLQKMEEYDGVVILATNLRKNLDEAFVRRLHFTIEFPFPAAADRQRIWERIWPEQTPRDPHVALDVMARRFEIAGGNIRNVALAAAFLAASDGGVVNMTHLLHATRREYQKMGKVVSADEFAA